MKFKAITEVKINLKDNYLCGHSSNCTQMLNSFPYVCYISVGIFELNKSQG